MDVAFETEAPWSVSGEPGPYRKADYLALPDEPRCELLWGHLVVSPSPTRRNQHTVQALAARLREFGLAGGHDFLSAPMDVTLDDRTVAQPDLLLVHASRRAILAQRVEGAPDLAVEVLSPSTGRRDRLVKLALYARAGVAEYWIVDPERATIDFLELQDGTYRVAVADAGRYRSRRFPGLEIDLASLWSEIERALGGLTAG